MTKILAQILLFTTSLVINLGINILVMIYGWGLKPKSWTWIIVIYLIGQFIAYIFILAGKELD